MLGTDFMLQGIACSTQQYCVLMFLFVLVLRTQVRFPLCLPLQSPIKALTQLLAEMDGYASHADMQKTLSCMLPLQRENATIGFDLEYFYGQGLVLLTVLS